MQEVNVRMATLKDIAEATGLSITTVSRVMNNTASEVGISLKTQKLVREAAPSELLT